MRTGGRLGASEQRREFQFSTGEVPNECTNSWPLRLRWSSRCVVCSSLRLRALGLCSSRVRGGKDICFCSNRCGCRCLCRGLVRPNWLHGNCLRFCCARISCKRLVWWTVRCVVGK